MGRKIKFMVNEQFFLRNVLLEVGICVVNDSAITTPNFICKNDMIVDIFCAFEGHLAVAAILNFIDSKRCFN